MLWHGYPLRLENIGYCLSPAPVQSDPAAFRLNYHATKMPIKDITNEEKLNLYKVGKKPKEVQRISESEKCILFVDINEGGLSTRCQRQDGVVP